MVTALVLFVSCSSCTDQFEGGTYKPMQQDFDRVRLDHLCVIAKLIEEYENKAGHLPLAMKGNEKPVVVVIGTQEQKDYDNGRVPIIVDLETRAKDGKVPAKPEKVEMHTVDELTKELEDVLGRKISLPVDPQKVPVNKPSLYVLTGYQDVFDVSAYLHNAFPFARKMGDYNYKVAIGNRSNPGAGIWTSDDLMKQAEFRAFFKAPFSRSGYDLQTKLSEK
jgi:hypothetical protein